jgi:succinyl-diaminopimelate desuccinylase
MREHVDVDEVTELTAALVRIDTVNPPGNERAAADLCRKALEPFGATFDEVEPESGRTSLLARVGNGNQRTLIVNGHLDVVPIDPSAWTHDPFGAEIIGDRMYGRGTTDMKGGIAAAICALNVLQRAGRQPSCDIVFHLVADEERGGALGAAVLADQGLIKGDACLVPEPTSLAIGVGERGLLVMDVTTIGTPAHGSQPQNGVSAIEKASKIVLAIHAADFGEAPHDLLGKPTANVGVIAGGSGHNTVSEWCTVTIDRRVLPGYDRDKAVAEITKRIDAIDDADLRYKAEVVTWGEPSELDRNHAFVGQVRDAVASVLGTSPPVVGMGFTTDARFVRNQAGVPAVVCGPGDVERAHTNDEWISIEKLAAATAAYAQLYESF